MKAFRPARAASAGTNLAKTLVQSGVFWLVFLVALPLGIARLEEALGFSRFAFPGQHALAWLLGALMAALNLASGVVMAMVGRGTPFPLDTARKLVVRGPYRFVRNPMALGGLGLGLAVALAMGSWLTVLYVAFGGVLWHLVARPLEERDLLARFGAPYARYQREVRCWWPRLRPFAPDVPDALDDERTERPG